MFRILLPLALAAGLPASAAEKPWPFCSDRLMPDETVLFSSDVEPRRAKLLFRPIRIRSVTAANGSRKYVEGIEQIDALQAPDLVMIAFGMNDGRKPGNTDAYAGNLRAMIAALRQPRPEVEILLVANMLPNGEFSSHEGHFANLEALRKLADQTDRVAVADVMSVTAAMLERKKFADLCGNHVNHPNDFIHRLYAAVILRTLGVE